MTSNFVGSYIEDMKLCLKASVLSQQHCILLSAPGWGKTDVALAAAHKCAGPSNGVVFLRFAPSTPPQKVEGMFDPAGAIASPPRFELVRTGTAYDPQAKIIIADEIGRPSDIVFDIMIDVLDRRDLNPADTPVVWGTSNFSPASARTEALRDRIALWHWIKPGVPDIRSIIEAHAHALRESLEIGDFPSWSEVAEVRNADPGKHAIEVCKDLLELLGREAAKAGMSVNPRRTTQWLNILFRTNMYFKGTADFDSLEPEATKCLIWAWMCTDETQANEWAKIASCVMDIVGSAIDALTRKTLEQVKTLMQQNQSAPRSKLAIELGRIIEDGKDEIEQLGSSDPRIKKALSELETVFVRIAKGDDPFK